jgi:hypothetical protein
MCVAFMLMHLAVLECKKSFKNAIRSCPNLPRIFRIFLEFILIFLSYFYLLEGSKILFHEPQMLYLDCSYLNLPLGIFLDFYDFLSIFRALKHFKGISWNCFRT